MRLSSGHFGGTSSRPARTGVFPGGQPSLVTAPNREFVENWFQITGGRSRMMATVPGVANRSPVAVGTLADLGHAR